MLSKLLKIVLFLIPLNSNACVVLLYHHFDTTTPASTSISPKLFEKQLEYIKQNNFSVLTTLDLINHLKTKKRLPNKCVVLTADDAYKSIYKNAYPILKKYQYPMSVFVATKGVDRGYNALMDYETMNTMKDLVSFYNHSLEHKHFPLLNKETVKNSIEKAQEKLKNSLGVTSKIFAYPYGEYSLENYMTIKELDYVAFGQHSGAIGLDSDLYALPRFPMTNMYGQMKSFITKVNTLPMPIIDDGVKSQVAQENPPQLKLKFKKRLQLNCFVEGELAEIIWRDNLVTIVAKKRLSKGRAKYNCTSYNKKQKRFHWYSKQWIIK